MLDCLIINGSVIDGSGAPVSEKNIGILGDRIAYVGSDLPRSKTIIDAKGLIVSPGFIDTHGHSEFTLLADGRAEGKILQGITTEINGNCGLSAAPLLGEAFERREIDLEELGITDRWSTFNEYFEILNKRGISLNFITLCGHGNIRASVIGYRDIPPDEDSMNDMKRLLSESIGQGAKGLSTGLIYPPGIYCKTEELIELCKTLNSNSNFIYTSHMRSEGDELIESVEEVIDIAIKAGVRAHVSHIKTMGKENWHKVATVLQCLENARRSGADITCDRYPYIASSTDLDSILPAWVFDGGVEEELKRLSNIEILNKIRYEMRGLDDDYWRGVYISLVNRDENKWMEGQTLYDISVKSGMTPIDIFFRIAIDERARAGAIFFSMSEDNLKKFLSLSYSMIGTDSSARSFTGTTASGKPHPRGFGSFPRFIGRYVRDEGLMSLSEAVRKASYLPALTFGIEGRGLISEGFYADIVIFDYDRIYDTANFREPFKKPEGISNVFVNGVMTVNEGKFTGALAGRILK
jgi:N-acyl-D-amino-acid deacylase